MAQLNPQERAQSCVACYYYPLTDAVSCSMHEMQAGRLKEMKINPDLIREAIYRPVIQRMPILTPAAQPDFNKLLSESPLFVRQPGGDWVARGKTVIVSHWKGRIFFEPVREGGRKSKKRFHRQSLALLSRLMTDHFGVPCRARYLRRRREYIIERKRRKSI